ncbi:hypothetical protein ABIA35_008108 [Catenulispora sp. MAP12-49]|uniref:hypothetical protein n=1 Tax=Catenulispora sp. MAP12-49 TaxID=3156302 RepID=UPI003517F05D
MSKFRTAVLMQNATGMTYQSCRQSTLDRRSSHWVPVPDPWSRAQAHFEALVVHTLADQLRDRQLDGAVLGITAVDVRAWVPKLILHPTMASYVISLLLPHYDSEYGGVRGLPGARPVHSHGRLVIVDRLGDAAVELAMANAAAPPNPTPRPEMRADWRQHTMTAEETEERAWWESKGRPGFDKPVEQSILNAEDLLFSRLLRRPRIVNRVAGSHGFVNSYTHGTDLVLEWCCGVSHLEMRNLLDQSGLTHQIAHITPWNNLGADPERGTVIIERQEHSHSRSEPLLTLRSGQTCPSETPDERRQRMDAWYR